MSEVQDKPESKNEEVKGFDLQTTKEPTEKRTVSPKKINKDHSETLGDNSEDHSENKEKKKKDKIKIEPKPLTVGIRNIVAVLGEERKTEIKEKLKTLSHKGSSIAPVYLLDEVKDLLDLTLYQHNKIKALIRNPNSKRLTMKEKIENGVMIKTKESLIISNKAKIDALLEANRVLRADIKALKGN